MPDLSRTRVQALAEVEIREARERREVLVRKGGVEPLATEAEPEVLRHVPTDGPYKSDHYRY